MKLLVAVALLALGALAYLGAHRSASPPARTQAHQGAPAAVKKKPKQVSLVWAGDLTQWSGDLKDERLARKRIKAAKADVVWVVMHAGAEGSDKGSTPKGNEIAFGEDRGNTRSFARMAIKAGADLVTGSGPHVVRGMEIYQGKLIAYLSRPGSPWIYPWGGMAET